MRFNPRNRVFVNARMQGALVVRVAAYWFFSIVAVGLILLCLDIAQGPWGPFFDQVRFGRLWEQYASVAIASFFILPVILADTVLTSNRIAGPLVRVRAAMRALAAGQPMTPLQFRKHDLWYGVAEELNAVMDYVERLKDRTAIGAGEGDFDAPEHAELAAVGGRQEWSPQ